ncbi:MAG: hypothetical protein ACK4GQ_06185, partial [Candidatus Hadarchaeales archaeon]
MPLLPEPISGGHNGARLGSMDGRIYYLRASTTTGFWVLENLRYYPSGCFTSRIFDAREVVSWDNISWDAATSSQTTVRFQVSTSNDGTTWGDFVGPDNTPSSYFTISSGESMDNIGEGRYIRYRAYLSTDNENTTPVLKWVKITYTTPWNIDNFNEDFAQGTHENTENTDDTVQLFGENVNGRFTSRIFDAGQVVVWDNLTWRAVTPSIATGENDNVGGEPETLRDGNSRIGVLQQNNYTATHAQDGAYEVISENTPVPTWLQTGWSGGKTAPTAEVGQWSSTYNKFYDNDNATGSDGENIKLVLTGGPSGSWTQTRWSGIWTRYKRDPGGSLLQVGAWTSSYDNFYWSENLNPSSLPGENLMLRGSPSAWENVG